jgi:ferritin-like metal-binding protein YciE
MWPTAGLRGEQRRSPMTVTASEDVREAFITGLRNAHAMEKQALSIMEPQVGRLESYPDVARRLEDHIRETHGQIDRLETILTGLGESASGLKDMALSVVGGMAAMGHTVAGDEILKNTLANFAFENYELAAYSSLITLAEAGGYADAKPALLKSLGEEQAMAEWIGSQVPNVTLRFISLREAGEQASH